MDEILYELRQHSAGEHSAARSTAQHSAARGKVDETLRSRHSADEHSTVRAAGRDMQHSAGLATPGVASNGLRRGSAVGVGGCASASFMRRRALPIFARSARAAYRMPPSPLPFSCPEPHPRRAQLRALGLHVQLHQDAAGRPRAHLPGPGPGGHGPALPEGLHAGGQAGLGGSWWDPQSPQESGIFTSSIFLQQ